MPLPSWLLESQNSVVFLDTHEHPLLNFSLHSVCTPLQSDSYQLLTIHCHIYALVLAPGSEQVLSCPAHAVSCSLAQVLAPHSLLPGCTDRELQHICLQKECKQTLRMGAALETLLPSRLWNQSSDLSSASAPTCNAGFRLPVLQEAQFESAYIHNVRG